MRELSLQEAIKEVGTLTPTAKKKKNIDFSQDDFEFDAPPSLDGLTPNEKHSKNLINQYGDDFDKNGEFEKIPKKFGIIEKEKIGKIQLIQKHVKQWLLTRHQQDIEHVTDFLSKQCQNAKGAN